MSIFGNLSKAKEKAGKKGAGFFTNPGSYVCEVKEVYQGKIKNKRGGKAGQFFATVTVVVKEALSGSLIEGDERKVYYGLGFPGSEAVQHEIAMANLVRDMASILKLDIESMNQTIMDTFFEEDGEALAVGAKVKVEVTTTTKDDGRTFTDVEFRGITPVMDPEELLKAVAAEEAE